MDWLIRFSLLVFLFVPRANSLADERDASIPTLRYTDVHDYADLCSFAKEAAKRPVAPTPVLPEPLKSWQYDDYTKVSFDPSRATWFNQGLPFWLETFHRGFVQVDLVELFTLIPIADGKAVSQRISFSKEDFRYAEALDEVLIPSVGHAGFKIVGRFPDRTDAEEIVSFLGSSYFRGRSSNCVYGASARGLAIDIAMNKDEEFPDFRAFWIRMPSRDDDEVTVLAHLDSDCVSGAYRFQLQPGNATTKMHVDARLYFRRVPDKVAIAPLTSMWIWGDGLKGPAKDARPSVHDSDGLLVRSGSQDWSWRAFARQDYPSVTSSDVEQLYGFGLIQRNRAFFHYDDHNARYDKRPSVWVSPDVPWNDGKIELLELPGAHEGVDNLATYWVSDKVPRAGQAVELGYSVEFFAGDPVEHNVLARATNLSVDRSEADQAIGVEVRFAGKVIRALPADCPIRIDSHAIHGSVSDAKVAKTDTGDWILTANVTPEEKVPVELSWQLFSDGEAVSEEFRYLLPPTEPEFVYPAVYTRQE